MRRRSRARSSRRQCPFAAWAVCPHHPDFSGPCDCRKPATLLFQRAAKELDLDLGASWYVGDKLRDILPARALGGHGILVPTSQTPPSDIETGLSCGAADYFVKPLDTQALLARLRELSS